MIISWFLAHTNQRYISDGCKVYLHIYLYAMVINRTRFAPGWMWPMGGARTRAAAWRGFCVRISWILERVVFVVERSAPQILRHLFRSIWITPVISVLRSFPRSRSFINAVIQAGPAGQILSYPQIISLLAGFTLEYRLRAWHSKPPEMHAHQHPASQPSRQRGGQ